MHLGGKYKISWSNDALESFLQIWALCAPHESIMSQGAMADRVKKKGFNEEKLSDLFTNLDLLFFPFFLFIDSQSFLLRFCVKHIKPSLVALGAPKMATRSGKRFFGPANQLLLNKIFDSINHSMRTSKIQIAVRGHKMADRGFQNDLEILHLSFLILFFLLVV